MSKFLEKCHPYLAKIYERKSGRYYTFSVVAKNKTVVKQLVEEYSKQWKNIQNSG